MEIAGTVMVSRSRKRNRRPSALTRSPLYTTKIIKASALLSDTKTLLSHWDLSLAVKENLDCFRQENLFGKSSRSRIENILRIFRQRYLADESVTRALVTLVRGCFPGQSLDRLLYFHSARADTLLHDVVTEILATQKRYGIIDINMAAIEKTLGKWVSEGRTTTKWSGSTILRVAQGLMSTLRDFGILEGAVNKRNTAVYLPVESFAYIAFYLKQQQPSGSKMIDHPDWKLFFLPHAGVERFLVEAHQEGLLEYHAAGNVIRLTFPAETLEEYANVLVERTH